MREGLRRVVETRGWEYAVITIIILNAATLGLETSQPVMARFGNVLQLLDRLFLYIFLAELLLRLVAYGPRFFLRAWNIFDFAIIAVSLTPANGAFTVLRTLRILRLLRLISAVPSLRRVVGGLLAALPGMGSVLLLMALVYYVFGVMATKLYGADFPDWFGNIGASLYSLFQIMTLESWSMGIVRPVMQVHPHAWLFFVSFILCTAFTVLNLFIGIIVSAMQEEHESTANADRRAIQRETEKITAEIAALRREIQQLRSPRD